VAIGWFAGLFVGPLPGFRQFRRVTLRFR